MTLRQVLMIATGAGLIHRGLQGAGAYCFLLGCDPARVYAPVSGWRCKRCHLAGASLDDFASHVGLGHVAPMRRTFTREGGGTVTRSSDYPGERTH